MLILRGQSESLDLDVAVRPDASRRIAKIVLLMLATLLIDSQLPNSRVFGQSPAERGDYFQPLNQHLPPGTAASWARTAGRATPMYFQPIRFELPGLGTVTMFDQARNRPVSLPAPAQVGFAVGHVYRLRISHMPEFPGIELYPSIEVLDRLHPPDGLRDRFPVPVDFTRDEIELALDGRLVTRVVYLEQPQFAVPRALDKPMSVLTFPERENLFAEADRRGRPLVIIRIGGRLPSVHGPDPGFFGSRAPFLVSSTQPKQKEADEK